MEKQKVLVELKQVCKSFDGKSVLNNLDLQIYNGEFLTILGPSGCGKTTTLRLIAGFEHADSGDIILDGKKINNIPANNREVHTVFQNYALFPHMTVFENIAFGLKMHKVPKTEIKDKVMEVLRIVKLEEFVDRKTAIYRVKSCNNEYVEINSIYAEVYETGMRFDMSMYWGDYEEWSKKADEIRKQNVLASQLINFEKSYVENENGEKFYSSKSSYAGNGLTTDGKLRMWNTFDLTKYNMTDKLKVVLITIDNEQIIIELER